MMSNLRRSSRIRKTITTIDQNLDDTEKLKRRSKKRSSTEDDEQNDFITPKKRTSIKKLSPYFTEKPKPVKTKKPKKNPATTVTTNMQIDDPSESESDPDDWEEVAAKENEQVLIEKLLKDSQPKESQDVRPDVAVALSREEIDEARRKRKKNLDSREHQLDLQLKRVLKKNFLKRHKLHIFFNLAHGVNLVRRLIHNRELQSMVYSLMDESMIKLLSYDSNATSINHLPRLLDYFNEIFLSVDMNDDDSLLTLDQVRQSISANSISSSSSIRVILFAIFVHLLNFKCRLVFAADLPPIRPKLDKSSNSKANLKKINKQSSEAESQPSRSKKKLEKNDLAISPTIEESKRLKNRYYWIELFIDKSDDGYVPIDVATSAISSSNDFETKLSFSMLYVWAFETDPLHFSIDDVTKLYSFNWSTSLYRRSHINHKTNGDPKWYENFLNAYQSKEKNNTRYRALESKKIEDQLALQPVPQKKSELIGHPLYVLRSKLLKFEGVYPNDTQPIGWLKEEPIYLRENVYILRSKQTWLKEARQVNFGEEPYKIVDGRIKNSDKKMGVTKRPELELFGEWQTSEYVPPIAQDGIVPCNEYGNVDLFKPEMIPVGCVHIVEPHAVRLCKKLGINYAEAITGFDAHGGGSHPVIEGIVICQEFEQTLREALEQHKQILVEKELKKKEERVFKNWRKLTRGLIIRENLAKKYGSSKTEDDDQEFTNEIVQQVETMDDDDDEYI